jgi:hypothetical protein
MLYRGMRVAGVPERESLAALWKTAMDSMPAIRQKSFLELRKMDRTASTTEIAEAIAHPSQTTRRALEDLEGHCVLNRFPQGPGKADLWALSSWATELYASAATFPDFPEKGQRRSDDSPPPDPPSTSLKRDLIQDARILATSAEVAPPKHKVTHILHLTIRTARPAERRMGCNCLRSQRSVNNSMPGSSCSSAACAAWPQSSSAVGEELRCAQ